MGGQFGGAGNFNMFSMNTVLSYEGMINENYFMINQRETELSANLEILKCITKNPFKNKLEYFIGLLTKSKYDGIGRQLDDIDISIALDISGSMSSIIDPKPTFKEKYEQTGKKEVNQMHNNDGKNRLEMAKECLFKLVNSMTDKMQLALTTFDDVSKVIIPLSPKKEIQSISHVIQGIREGGGTNLAVALEGAANCLNGSKAKFKRVIIITDGWDNNPRFMELARELNHKNILITILSIDSGSNSQMYEKFSELKGCNYYFILNENDMEKYLVKQLNYICFPVLYDMKINFMSDDAEIIRAIGCGQQNEKSKENENKTAPSNELINAKTLFPSDLKEMNGKYYQEGGLILLKIKPKSLEKDCKITINLKYDELEGNHFENNYEINFNVNEMKNGAESIEMKKGLAMYYFTKFIRKIKKFMNLNIQFTHNGPVDSKEKRPEQKYFNFLSRNFENFDKIKIYFENNYKNDLNEYQKEYYLKNLDEQYEQCEKKMKEYQN